MKQLDFIPLIFIFITYKLGGVRELAIVLVVASNFADRDFKWKYGINNKKLWQVRSFFWTFNHLL